MKLIKTIRNNWKKSIFFSLGSIYGGKWAKRKLDDEDLRREFCSAANAFGQEAVAPYSRLRHVTVLLNPAAGDNSSKKLFEKNVAPLLHLAGLDVHIVKTEFEGQATGYMDVIEKGSTDAVILVGGSGLVMEAVTGLLRRPDSEDIVDTVPLGIIPTGKHNTLIKAMLSPFLPRSPTLDDVKFMGEAAMAIVRGKTTKIDVLKIEAEPRERPSKEQTSEELTSDLSTPPPPTTPQKKTVYAISGLEWGMHREVAEVTDKYWYWGRRLKARVAYVFSILTFDPAWPKSVAAELKYVDACQGCSKCFGAEMEEKRRKSREAMNSRSLFQKIFTSSTTTASTTREEEEREDKSHVDNPECGEMKETKLEGCQIVAALNSVQRPSSSSSFINLYSLPTPSSRWSFVAEGWRRLKERTSITGFEAPDEKASVVRKVREFYLEPIGEVEGDDDFLSVDDERFEVMPLKVALMKRRITCFVPQ